MNDDLISRSELKKAVENLVAGGEERLIEYYKNGSKSEENEWIGGIYDAWEEIIDAPTIEVRDNFDVGYVQGLEDGRKEKTHGEWIPVSERLPDDREWYLAIFQETDTGWVNPLPFICEYMGNVTKFTTQDGWLIRDCTDVDNPHEYYTKLLKCVAWHPLPEPYKEEENE